LLHPLVDRGSDHREDELKRRRHWSSDCPFAPDGFEVLNRVLLCENFGNEFPDGTG
jgi:hypothetical protein